MYQSPRNYLAHNNKYDASNFSYQIYPHHGKTILFFCMGFLGASKQWAPIVDQFDASNPNGIDFTWPR
jgi:hypothetical protein